MLVYVKKSFSPSVKLSRFSLAWSAAQHQKSSMVNATRAEVDSADKSADIFVSRKSLLFF